MFQFLCVVTQLSMNLSSTSFVLVSLCCYIIFYFFLQFLNMFQFLCVVTQSQQVQMHLPASFSFFVLLLIRCATSDWAKCVLVSLCCYLGRETLTTLTTSFSFFVLLPSPEYCGIHDKPRFSFFVLLHFIQLIKKICCMISFSFFVLLQWYRKQYTRSLSAFQFLCVVTFQQQLCLELQHSVLVSLCCYCCVSSTKDCSQWFQFLCVVTCYSQAGIGSAMQVLVSLCCYFCLDVALDQLVHVLVSLCCYIYTNPQGFTSSVVLVSLCCYTKLKNKEYRRFQFQFLCVVTPPNLCEEFFNKVLVSLCCYQVTN